MPETDHNARSPVADATPPWRRSWLRKSALLLGLGVVLLAGAALLLPRLLDLERVRARLESALSAMAQGSVRIAKVDAALLPWPKLSLYAVGIDIPGRAAGTIASLEVKASLVGLWQRRISRIALVAPELLLRLPAAGSGGPAPAAADRWAALLERMQAILPQLPLESVSLDIARLRLETPDGPGIELRAIRGVLDADAQRLRFNLRCGADLWRELALHGELRPSKAQGEAQLALHGVSSAQLAPLLPAGSGLAIGEDRFDVELAWTGLGLSQHQLQLSLSMPQLGLKRQGRSAQLRDLQAGLRLSLENGALQVDLENLSLAAPRLSATGRLTNGASDGGSRIELQGAAIDSAALRQTVLALAADLEPWAVIFAIVRGGQIPQLRLTTWGPHPAALFGLDRLELEGRIEAGQVHVPGSGLECEEVYGTVRLANGVLTAEQLQARLGATRGNNGQLRVALRKGGPWNLFIDVAAELSQLPGVLHRVVSDAVFREEISRVQALQGTATGKLTLDASAGQVRTAVEVASFNLQGRHGRCPYPIEARGSGLHFAGAELALADADVRIGASHSAHLAGKLNWQGAPMLELQASGSELDLGQIHAWLAAGQGDGTGGPAAVEMRAGQAMLSSVRLSGPLLQPGQWSFNAAGEVRELLVTSARLAATLHLPQGQFSASERHLTLKKAHLSLDDADLLIDGTLQRASHGAISGALDLDGQVGAAAWQRLREPLGMPMQLAVTPPLRLSGVSVQWQPAAAVVLKGKIADGRDAQWSGQVRIDGKNVRCEPLAWLDGQSRGQLNAVWQDGRLQADFHGRLTAESINSWLAPPLLPAAAIEGDLRLDMNLSEPLSASVEGELRATGIALPLPDGGPPLEVVELAVESRANRLGVRRLELARGANRLSLAGNLWRESERLRFDLDAQSPALDAKQLWSPADAEHSSTGGLELPRVAGRPLHGILRFKADELSYGSVRFRPLIAHATLDSNAMAIELAQAGACGLNAAGRIELSPTATALNLQLLAQEGSLDEAFVCFGREPGGISGRYAFQAEIKGQAHRKEILPALQGRFELHAGAGRATHYSHFGVLRSVFAVLNVTEVFRGRLPDLDTEGFAFESIRGKANLQHGQLLVEELVIDGQNVDLAMSGTVNLVERSMDLGILAAPLKTANYIIQMVPLVRDIMEGTLVSIPVRLQGPIANPSATPMSPTMVGSSLLGIMKRTLQLPFKIIQPLLPSDATAP